MELKNIQSGNAVVYPGLRGWRGYKEQLVGTFYIGEINNLALFSSTFLKINENLHFLKFFYNFYGNFRKNLGKNLENFGNIHLYGVLGRSLRSYRNYQTLSRKINGSLQTF